MRLKLLQISALIAFIVCLLVLNKKDARIVQNDTESSTVEVIIIEVIVPVVVEASTETVEDVYEREYSEEDLYLLSHLIYGEAGSDKCSDKLQRFVGSVVLNRVRHKSFPNTIKDVIFAPGQYQCTWNGSFELEPDERAIRNAEEILKYGSELPQYVVYQAEFEQGNGFYIKEQNMYFCVDRDKERYD